MLSMAMEVRLSLLYRFGPSSKQNESVIVASSSKNSVVKASHHKLSLSWEKEKKWSWSADVCTTAQPNHFLINIKNPLRKQGYLLLALSSLINVSHMDMVRIKEHGSVQTSYNRVAVFRNQQNEDKSKRNSSWINNLSAWRGQYCLILRKICSITRDATQ